MFGLFKNKNQEECPVSEEKRQWFDRIFYWSMRWFGRENVIGRKILTPDFSDFPIKYTGDPQTAIDTLKIVSKQMEINPDDVVLEIYEAGQKEIYTGGVDGGGRMFLNREPGDRYLSGLYLGKLEDGKYHIGMEAEQLTEPVEMIAVLGRQLAHIKILGEGRLKENNEHVADALTVMFGMGIFNANACFQTKRGVDHWGWTKVGYLSQMEWGYLLAVFSWLRKEENPDWIKYLNVNIKSDFKRSMNFILNNEEKILNYDPKKKVNESDK